MAFCADAWAATAATRAEIDRLPFLLGLADGTLPRAAFEEYLRQDALYLADYARLLATAASLAPRSSEVAFWAGAAEDCVAVELALHETRVGQVGGPPGPACADYLAHLWSLASEGRYPVLVAGLLPCFWVYQDVGERLHRRAPEPDHPYAEWLATYDDPALAAATRTACAIADLVAAESDPATVRHMHEAFARSVDHEREFWRAPCASASG